MKTEFTSGEQLMELARQATQNSYAPYSHYHVGAAILCASGNVYQGCNVEISNYGGTICAERTAAVKAISEGEEKFLAVAVTARNFNKGGKLVMAEPCGHCRQFLYQFAAPEMVVYLDEGEGTPLQVFSLRELLPFIH